MEFSRLEYWSELPFPSPGDLPDLGTEPKSTQEPTEWVSSGFRVILRVPALALVIWQLRNT